MAIASSQCDMTQHGRLSIAHLLLWTCGLAAGLRCYLALMPADFQEWILPLGHMYTAVMAFACGTFVAGTGVIADQRYFRQQACPCLPGHWLLLLGFGAVLVGGATVAYDGIVLSSLAKPEPWLSTYWCQFSLDGTRHGLALKHQTIGWGLGSIVAMGFLLNVRGQISRCWVWVFALFFLAGLILFGGYLVALLRHMGLDTHSGSLWMWYLAWCRRSGEIYASLFAICGAGILWAVVHDVHRRAHSDWLHWTGIGTWLVVAAIQIATFTVIAFHG